MSGISRRSLFRLASAVAAVASTPATIIATPEPEKATRQNAGKVQWMTPAEARRLEGLPAIDMVIESWPKP